jgi:Secretion system C-terminal sorting domain
MKKIIFLILIALNSVCFAQNFQWQNSYIAANGQEYVRSVSFINPNTGWVGAETGGTNARVLKTTNKGNNFSQVFNYLEYSTTNMSYDIGVNFINESTGFISTGDRIFKTTNGGNNWSSVFTFPSMNASSAIKFADNNTGYAAYSTNSSLSLFKTINGGNNWYETPVNGNLNNATTRCLCDISINKYDINKVAICGYHIVNNNHIPISFFIQSDNGFITKGNIYTYSGEGIFSQVILLPNNDVRVFGLKGVYSPNVFGPNLIFDMGTTDVAFSQTGFSFSNQNLGFAASYDGKIWKTTNSGNNYVIEANTGINAPTSSRMNSFNEIAYFGSNQNIFTRLLKSNLSLNGETGILSTSSKIKFDFTDYTNGLDQYLRGGFSNIQSDNVLYVTSNGTTNEMIFYKWQDNKMVNINPNFYFDYPQDIKAYYKSKQKSTDESAIANVNQTKAVRGSNGNTYQIHSSIGGIFFTIGSQPNLEFDKEEVVNGGQLYSQQFPNDNTADNNKNPSVNEIKYFGQENSAPSAFGLNAIWERYDQSTIKTNILCALRSTSNDNIWTRFGNNLNALDGKIISFNSSSGYNSKPEIYSFYMDGSTSDVRNFLMVVPHLEPSANYNKLIVSVRYKDIMGFDDEALRLEDPPFDTKDFIIVSDNISDYSVTGKYEIEGNDKCVYLYFTYKMNGNIYYRREKIYYSGTGNIRREAIPQEEQEYNISTIDNQILVNTPDITLRNGLPAITYQGKNYSNRIVSYEGSSDFQYLQSTYYPIIVKVRNAGGNWSSYLYNSNGFQTQENPDIEGSTNYNALLVNFSKANNTFYQFVKIDGLSGYNCVPGYYQGKDAKLIKGSYIGQFGVSPGPGILTLSNQESSTLYSVAKQQFSITNAVGIVGYDNMDGTIQKDNTAYSLTLGPIIVSNTTSNNNSTTVGFADDTPPQTVQNPVEFNETMLSAVFSLSNNDTLIIGAHGKYTASLGVAMQPLKYHVNLVNSNTRQIHRELFRDTIKTEDSVSIEFLRGYVINNIDKGTDQFFLQMVVDTIDAKDANFGLNGVYADNSVNAGDAPLHYKTKVFFENGSNSPKAENLIPKEYSLSQNYPNPFNPSTTIKYSLPKDGFVSLKIYDITGREVKTLASEVKKAGYYSVTFNASNLASGVYFYRIQSNDYVMTKRMVLIK